MTHLHDAAHRVVLHALLYETTAHQLTVSEMTELRDHAAGLLAIAEAQRVPVERLLGWIHLRTPEKEWSLGEWRAWCRAYNEDQRP